MKRKIIAVWAYTTLLFSFLIQLVFSAWSVAMIVVGIQSRIRPAIIGYPLDVKSDFEIALLANLVSLTPGTTSLHVSDDRSTLYIHVMDATDTDQIIADIKTSFESRLLRGAA
jgi:multicomponent Na+:H+ antiporter subunit E